ncbi:MAG TPA: DUF1559 domain-containing protein [Thermoguttaceae bacterium]|nr:DUF1559 domain-containing protein [Thermoguttaceae bacterium]
MAGSFNSDHATVCNFAFGDGTVRSIADTIDARVFKFLGNRADGEILLDSPTREGY